MDFDEYKKMAKEMAAKQLERGFDAEAFLILLLLETEDRLPGSEVDEYTDLSKELYVNYFENRTPENLELYLTMLYRIISEVYHSSEDPEEQEKVKKYINSLQNII